jgi:anti-anti-sigma factor
MPPGGPRHDHGCVTTDTRADVLVCGDEALISLHGELDLFTLDVLRDALADVPRVSRVVIDLQDVEFMDCAALRFIEGTARRFAADSRTLRVEHASRLVNRLIELLKLDGLRVR